MPEFRLEYLLDCYIKDNCNGQEEAELMAILANPENEELVQDVLSLLMQNMSAEKQLSNKSAVSILERILKKDNDLVIPKKNSKNIFSLWLRMAAAVLILLVGAYFIFEKKKAIAGNGIGRAREAMVEKAPSAIVPGSNRAMLITSDGKAIVLDSMQNGLLAKQGNNSIQKKEGLLIYKAPSSFNADGQISYNTLSTPRGGQYQVILSDGSKVWLNAASSIRFPTAFSGKLREVTLTGEAYFEVAKNKEKPFKVNVGAVKIAVLGTHFNVNAYDDEAAIKTTLLEGCVEINNGKSSGLLKPGQQAVVSSNKEDKIKTGTVDLTEVTAWKNGLFQFDGADITTIMRAIGRWYDVEILYSGKVPKHRFVGKISRNVALSEVLRILALSNIKFSVVGKKIIVQ